MKFQRHEIQVSGSRVLAKQYNEYNNDHYNWVEIASFRFQKGVCHDPESMAKKYAESLVS